MRRCSETTLRFERPRFSWCAFSGTVFLIGVGSMVAAYGAFALAMTDESPISAPPWLVPAVVVLAGAIAAIVDRRPRGLVTVLGGAGAVAGLAAIKAIETGTIPPTINLETPDPDCDLDYVPNTARTNQPVDRVLINGFGFGGQNASALFGKLR